MWFGADRKVSIERWYLSPYVEKPLNSKVIKSLVLELRSRKCFSCFGIPMFYVIYIYVRYGHYERFTYRYEYVYFTYPYHGMLHIEKGAFWSPTLLQLKIISSNTLKPFNCVQIK